MPPGRVSRAALVSPAAVATGKISRMIFEVALPMLAYRARPTRKRLLRAAKPILTDPEDRAIRQVGAIYRNVRLDTGLPRMATEEELGDYGGPVAVSRLRMPCSSPPGPSYRARGRSFPTSFTPKPSRGAGKYLLRWLCGV